jgi:ABC-2 type transport system ATP-binding protein
MITESAAEAAIIRVTGLTHEYPGRRALTDLSFAIRRGTITALVGPNGAGKTTLLRCLAGLIRPFDGDIRIGGVSVLENPRRCHRMIGYLPDFYGLYDALTVDRALRYMAAAQKLDRAAIPGRVAATAEALGLADRLGEKIGRLSRGMRQRVAIAQALVHDPEILLLDEPASGLDPEARLSLSRLFVTLNRQGKTLMVSSHILAELDQYAGELMMIRDGRLVRHLPVAGETAGTVLLRLRWAVPDLADLLERMPGVRSVALEDDGKAARIEISGEPEAARAELLRALIAEDFPVTDFTAAGTGLQARYLETASGAGT